MKKEISARKARREEQRRQLIAAREKALIPLRTFAEMGDQDAQNRVEWLTKINPFNCGELWTELKNTLTDAVCFLDEKYHVKIS